jgi:hypothetical protein
MKSKGIRWLSFIVIAGTLILLMLFHTAKPKPELISDPSLNLPKGNFVAKGVTGTLICTSSETYEDFIRVQTQYAEDELGALENGQPKPHPEMSSMEDLTKSSGMPVGCNYVPPGTPLVSEGGISNSGVLGPMAIVTAQMHDGTTIRGVTTPDSLDSILKGNVVATIDGAVICPNSKTWASFDSAWIQVNTASLPNKPNVSAKEGLAKSNGCNFILPGTSLVSEGEAGPGVEGKNFTLIVTAKMPDGIALRGVTDEDEIEQPNRQQSANPSAAETSPSAAIEPEKQQTEPVQPEVEPQQQIEPEQQDATPRMGRDGMAGGQASDRWQKVQSEGQEIYVKTNGFFLHRGALYVEGNCETRHYFVLGSSMPMESAPPENSGRELVPNSPFEKAFDLLCKIAREKSSHVN